MRKGEIFFMFRVRSRGVPHSFSTCPEGTMADDDTEPLGEVNACPYPCACPDHAPSEPSSESGSSLGSDVIRANSSGESFPSR